MVLAIIVLHGHRIVLRLDYLLVRKCNSVFGSFGNFVGVTNRGYGKGGLARLWGAAEPERFLDFV